jgi:hypothetical protein
MAHAGAGVTLAGSLNARSPARAVKAVVNRLTYISLFMVWLPVRMSGAVVAAVATGFQKKCAGAESPVARLRGFV